MDYLKLALGTSDSSTIASNSNNNFSRPIAAVPTTSNEDYVRPYSAADVSPAPPMSTAHDGYEMIPISEDQASIQNGSEGRLPSPLNGTQGVPVVKTASSMNNRILCVDDE